MNNPDWWQIGNARVVLLVEGENAETFVGFVKNHLNHDFYSSLVTIRENFNASEEYKSVSFCLCILSPVVLYALSGGAGKLDIIRDGKTVSVSSLVSGSVKEGDKFELHAGSLSFIVQSREPKVEEIARMTVKQKVVGVIDKLLARIPERRIIINEPAGEGKRSKKASLIGVFLLLILGVSIYFGIARQQNVRRIQEYEPQLLSAIHDFDEALELSNLSQARSRELILKSRETAKKLSEDEVGDERLNKLLEGISEHLGPIAGIYEFSPSLFLDLGIVASNFKGSDLALSGGVIRVLDKESKRLVGIEVENKRTNVISGPDYLPDAMETAAYADRSFILSSDGIREVTEDVELLIQPEWEPQNVLTAAFAGNMYILDKPGSQIWRYQGVTGGFLEKEEWLGEGISPNFNDVVSWGIDGVIWTVNSSGDVNIYSLGAPATFSITGATSSFSKVQNIFVSEENRFVYLLDQGSSRIAVVGKNGQYMGEYLASELEAATDLAVDEEHGIIIFLANGKLYSLEARHLEEGNESN